MAVTHPYPFNAESYGGLQFALFRVEALVGVPLQAEKMNMLLELGALLVLGRSRSSSSIRLRHLWDTQIGSGIFGTDRSDETALSAIKSWVSERVFSKTWHNP